MTRAVAHTPNAQHIVVDQCQRIGKLLQDLESIGQLEPKLPRVAARCHIDNTSADLDKAASSHQQRRHKQLEWPLNLHHMQRMLLMRTLPPLSLLSRMCMQGYCHLRQKAYLMANSLDESGLAAARRASAEVEEP